MSKVLRVAVTGAAGQIGYSILPRLISGEVFGKDTKVELSLIEVPAEAILKAAEGVAMELNDCGFETLKSIDIYDNTKDGFKNVDLALLIGSKPRGPGMDRSDLLKENGKIFVTQGKDLNGANKDVKVMVVGNPCNTNALIALYNSEVPKKNFVSMTMLDENRSKSQISQKAKVDIADIKNFVVWGNHSNTMVPDFENATIKGKKLLETLSDRAWLEGEFMKTVQTRGGAIIKARGKSSAASAASACLDMVMNFNKKTDSDTCFSASVFSDGTHYSIPEGIICSMPLQSDGQGNYKVVDNFKISDYLREKIDATAKELQSEKDAVKDYIPK